MIYNINIEEIVNGDYEIEANSKKEAFEIARKKYYNGEFVNEPGDVTCVKMAIARHNEDYVEWEKI